VNPGHPRDWAGSWPAGHALLSRSAQALPFDRAGWLALIADHLRDPATLRLLIAGRDGPECVLPLAVRGRGRVEAFACYYSFRFAPIFAPHVDSDARLALLVAAGAALAPHAWHCALAPLPAEDGDLLASAFAVSGWRAVVTPEECNHLLDVGGRDFDTYWAERPGSLRATYRRKAKGGAVTTTVYRHFDPAAWADYVDVYAHSWKDAEGSLPFLEAFAREEAAAGTLRLGIARHAGRAVAAQLWTVDRDKAMIHKLAYRTDARALSPGTILSHAMFREAIDTDRVARIDYGKGNDSYKRDWTDRVRARVRLDLVRPAHPLGQAWLAKHRLGALARRLAARYGRAP
jgi:CelD/BcsL family acetyltransferase involved in cellulose biosynthesis